MSDLNVSLAHAVPDTKRRTTFMRAREESDPANHPGQSVDVDTIIHDGRGRDLKLDEASFELVRHPTVLSTRDFFDASAGKVTSEYYDEMKALFQKVTGCAHVLMFHHQVRSEEKSDAIVEKDGTFSTHTKVQPYAHGIHSDTSVFSAEELFRGYVGSVPEECRQGRFLYINAWRNIDDVPIVDNHLAVLDERSLVKPDDYIQRDLYGVGYDVVQYTLSARNAAQHRWYYFPRMTKDEVLVFKQWDSDTTRPGRVCFHTAINDPSAPANAPCRQSIEARAILFFPDHSPNTCPAVPLPAAVDGTCDEATAADGAQKIKGGLAYIKGNTGVRAMVVTHMRAGYVASGARAVLAEFADDKQEHFGLRKASAATKERAVALLLEGGSARHVDELFAGSSPGALALAALSESRVAAAAFGAAAALTASALARKWCA